MSETNTQKETPLKGMVNTPTLRDAIDEVCSRIPKSAENTMEARALAQAFSEGVIWAFNSLYEKGGLKRSHSVLPQRFRPE